MDIKIQHVTKRYGNQAAVDGISFEVKTGEVLGFLGPNGAGKTTTMKMITSYISIDEGDILIGGTSVKTNPEAIKKHIGYLPEHNPLYDDMPVLDYLAFCGALQGLPKSKLEERVREMVRITGLNREKHKRINELSKGYRQRVGLAQAMIHDPEILILDEPTTGLDPNQIVEIRNLIRELGQEKTVILSTHILPEVEATCDRILIINNGRIVADGTASTLRQQAQGQSAVRVRAEGADLDTQLAALKKLPEVASADIADKEKQTVLVSGPEPDTLPRAVFNLCVQKGWVLLELTPLDAKLEDVFREVTVEARA